MLGPTRLAAFVRPAPNPGSGFHFWPAEPPIALRSTLAHREGENKCPAGLAAAPRRCFLPGALHGWLAGRCAKRPAVLSPCRCAPPKRTIVGATAVDAAATIR